MEERLYDLEDKVQDLELEVLSLRQQVNELEQAKTTKSHRGNWSWGLFALIPIVAIICNMIIQLAD
ncbi:hypothetical protein [Paenilisteria rocourtiae]|uniref:Uncharacterized protein n=1 Tax=Listeria rocourtiae TaxID=647910 RepID=A0A4R6ZPG5_9LIST|nr:hypothetical protein [Listeria rocourtiae]EUJ47898.1 hypothetical protein PROCOU_06943 [Listeria rocourtiae FSL F6-920]MBC1434861.1 hypothetical protein [Listeria rocourtiae]MBC1604635.1 hypothetical protein [Listeria rocourtiae]TDR54453.1 hypothetical protein DFP96_10236 [Listeria rocourtiae]